ncbi:MAG: hypothetical protein WD768_11720 [Phycisphaeraceae bacterium]
MKRRIASLFKSFHENQRGDTVQYILIIAIIALPIIIGLIVFRDKIADIFGSRVEEVENDEGKVLE